MAPEIILKKYTNLVDIFSLGVMTFQEYFDFNFAETVGHIRLNSKNGEDRSKKAQEKLNSKLSKVYREKDENIKFIIDDYQEIIWTNKEFVFKMQKYELDKIEEDDPMLKDEIIYMIQAMVQVSLYII